MDYLTRAKDTLANSYVGRVEQGFVRYADALLGVAATSLPEWDCQHLRNEATRSDLGMSRTTVKK